MLLIQRLGEASAEMGDLAVACQYYDRVVAYYEAHPPSNVHEQRIQAEAHLLYSKALFDLGNFDDGSEEMGSRGHVLKAQELLEKIETKDCDDKHELESLHRTRKSTKLQHCKLLLNRGEYERALQDFRALVEVMDLEGAADAATQGGDATDGVDRLPPSGHQLHRQLSVGFSDDSDVNADVLDFRQLYALALFKTDQREEARSAFDAIIRQTERDSSGTEVRASFV